MTRNRLIWLILAVIALKIALLGSIGATVWKQAPENLCTEGIFDAKSESELGMTRNRLILVDFGNDGTGKLHFVSVWPLLRDTLLKICV